MGLGLNKLSLQHSYGKVEANTTHNNIHEGNVYAVAVCGQNTGVIVDTPVGMNAVVADTLVVYNSDNQTSYDINNSGSYTLTKNLHGGTCSDTQYTTESTCTGAGGTWTSSEEVRDIKTSACNMMQQNIPT